MEGEGGGVGAGCRWRNEECEEGGGGVGEEGLKLLAVGGVVSLVISLNVLHLLLLSGGCLVTVSLHI